MEQALDDQQKEVLNRWYKCDESDKNRQYVLQLSMDKKSGNEFEQLESQQKLLQSLHGIIYTAAIKAIRSNNDFHKFITSGN